MKYLNYDMGQTCSSYQEYKSMKEESELRYLIHTKYLKVLGQFIENTYPGLRFDIFIRSRNPKEKKPQWYGHTYMELVIFDVISQPIYNPMTFEPVYRTTTYDGYFSMDTIYDDIDSFIPEINKHLMITFVHYRNPDQMVPEQFYNIQPFECWDKYWRYSKFDNNNKLPWPI
jgi:hypothetical protein